MLKYDSGGNTQSLFVFIIMCIKQWYNQSCIKKLPWLPFQWLWQIYFNFGVWLTQMTNLSMTLKFSYKHLILLAFLSCFKYRNRVLLFKRWSCDLKLHPHLFLFCKWLFCLVLPLIRWSSTQKNSANLFNAIRREQTRLDYHSCLISEEARGKISPVLF